MVSNARLECCRSWNSAFFQLYHGENKLILHWDDVRLVLDQHARLYLDSASHQNNSPQLDMSLHFGILFWFRANQSLLLLLNDACLAEKQQTPDRGSHPRSTALEASIANHYTTDAVIVL
jgi:hypothetical protein